MKPVARWSIIAAFGILALIGMFVSDPSRQMTTSSFGAVPPAYGALFELLSEVQLPVGRTYALPAHLPVDATVWWIEPSWVSHAAPASNPEDEHSDADDFRVGAWAEAGGTAVIFVPQHSAAIGDVAVPTRVGEHSAPARELKGDNGAPPAAGAEGEPAGSHSRRLEDAAKAGQGEEQYLAGHIVPQLRTLKTSELARFDAVDGWTVAATLAGQPFVLEQRRGRGRVVLVADAGFLTNAWLDGADNAPFAMDLVRAYGVPRFDERQHGLRAADSAVRYIATSAALPLFVGLTLLGVLLVWHGRALPPRSMAERGTKGPTLEVFVDSLAALYAGTRDYARVLSQYRELTAARLRRHFGLAPHTPNTVLLERLRSAWSGSREDLQCLIEDGPVASDADLRAAVQRLDTLVREATR